MLRIPVSRIALFFAALTACALPAIAQAPAQQRPVDPFAAISFVQGSWKSNSAISTDSAGYTFRLDAGRHVMVRYGRSISCHAPDAASCEHNDALSIYPVGFRSLKAFYSDPSGAVFNFDGSSPSSNTYIFLSDNAQSGPRYRLIFTLEDGVLTSKFQSHPPARIDWHTLTEWSGRKAESQP